MLVRSTPALHCYMHVALPWPRSAGLVAAAADLWYGFVTREKLYQKYVSYVDGKCNCYHAWLFCSSIMCVMVPPLA